MNIYIINLGSKSNHQNMFIHFIRDVLFIVTFGNFWHSQLSILSRDANMVQQTCIWLCGQAIWILTSVTPGVLYALLQAILIHVHTS